MLLAYQDREEGRNGGPFAPVVRSSGPQVLRLPRESEQDRGTEAQHHPTKRGTQQDQPPRCSRSCRGCRSCRSAPDGASKERKPTRKRAEASEERRKGKEAERQQAHKPTKGVPPPYCKGQAAVPLITNSRQKISKKSPWGSYEKIFGKIFRGNVSGERKTPRVISTGGGLF